MVRVAAVLVIPLFVAVIWLYQNNLSIRSDFVEVTNQLPQKTVTVNAPLGGLVNLQLPDGSTVWLDAGSKISYPVYFGSDKREVTLVGQAYFEIEKCNVPFFVKNAGPTVKVYGTEFSVSAYNNEENVIVALAEGKVSLNVNNKEILLKPGEISKFNKQARTFEIVETDINRFIKWKDGILIFRDATLSTIVRTLERRYNASIHIEDDVIANYKYNAILKGESFEQVLDLLTLSAPIKYTYIKPIQKEDFSYTQARVVVTKDNKRILNQ
jgi:ferric-dicitrate binding protein FerR (iron transport regulator)